MIDVENSPNISGANTLLTQHLTLKDDRSAFETLPNIVELVGKNRLDEGKDGYPEVAEFWQDLKEDRNPLPATADREHYYGDDHQAFWMSGLSDSAKMLKAMQKAACAPSKRLKYFELGCASGRVVRHMSTQFDAEVWCADINQRHIEWIRTYLDTSIKCFHNSTLPHLPLEDNYFDFVSAFSVFTHIDDFESAWLMELRRILKPGGIAYVTVQTEHSWEKYRQDWIKDQLQPLNHQVPDYDLSDEFFQSALPRSKTVIWWKARDLYNASVFHTTDIIKSSWGRYFEVLDINIRGHFYQDVVVLRKPL